LLLLVHADNRFTSAESEQPETRTYNYRFVPENSTVVQQQQQQQNIYQLKSFTKQ